MGVLAMVVGTVGALGVASLQSLRWWFVARPLLGIRYRDALAAILVANFFNVMLPARAGDALRVDDLSRRSGASRATLFGTELVDFLADKSGWLSACALVLFTGAPPTWMYRALIGMASMVIVVVLLAFLLRNRLLAAARRPDGWRGRLAAGLTVNRPGRLAVAALVVAAGPWLLETPILWEVARASGLHLSILQAFTVLTALNAATVVPTPGGVGPNEAASSATLLSFGIPPERAVLFALVYHATQLVPNLLAGGLLLLSRRSVASRRDATVLGPSAIS